jgi:hypothetical protein
MKYQRKREIIDVVVDKYLVTYANGFTDTVNAAWVECNFEPVHESVVKDSEPISGVWIVEYLEDEEKDVWVRSHNEGASRDFYNSAEAWAEAEKQKQEMNGAFQYRARKIS